MTDIYRKNLHFENNTVYIDANISDSWRIRVFDISSPDQVVYARNNIFHRTGDTNFQLLNQS